MSLTTCCISYTKASSNTDAIITLATLSRGIALRRLPPVIAAFVIQNYQTHQTTDGS
jgi:hypothetical protein